MNDYDWHLWFAWYPVRLWRGQAGPAVSWRPRFYPPSAVGYVWLRYLECRIHGEIAPNGDLTDWWEYREASSQDRNK